MEKDISGPRDVNIDSSAKSALKFTHQLATNQLIAS